MSQRRPFLVSLVLFMKTSGFGIHQRHLTHLILSIPAPRYLNGLLRHNPFSGPAINGQPRDSKSQWTV